MGNHFLVCLLAGLLTGLLACTHSAEKNQERNTEAFHTRPEEKRLFDGATFQGWQGDTVNFFRIEDGALVGGSLMKAVPHNAFLTTEQPYDNFLLTLEFRLLGDNANAGIQFRSERIPAHYEMVGYQADMGQHYWGCLYDESRRNTTLACPDSAALAQVLKPNGWNTYEIRAEGRRIHLTINGYPTVTYTEPLDTIPQTGLIGLQIHSGGPSEVWYKNITLRELP